MKPITVEGKGDHCYQHSFNTLQEANSFLAELTCNKLKWLLLEDDNYWDNSFDCEDDLIILNNNGKKSYCAGWHWLEEQDKPPIELNGTNLYQLFMELENK